MQHGRFSTGTMSTVLDRGSARRSRCGMRLPIYAISIFHACSNAGSNPYALDMRKWAQSSKEAFMAAAPFCITHSKAYHRISLDEAAAESHLDLWSPGL